MSTARGAAKVQASSRFTRQNTDFGEKSGLPMPSSSHGITGRRSGILCLGNEILECIGAKAKHENGDDSGNPVQGLQLFLRAGQ